MPPLALRSGSGPPPDGAICGVGIHAQWLWVDPARRIVVVKLSSRPAPSDDAMTQREIAMLSSLCFRL